MHLTKAEHLELFLQVYVRIICFMRITFYLVENNMAFRESCDKLFTPKQPNILKPCTIIDKA